MNKSVGNQGPARQFLSKFNTAQYKQFLSEFDIIKCAKNTVLIRKNQPQHYFYIVISGRLGVYISDQNQKEIEVANFEENDICGEISMLSENDLATANVISKTDCVLIRISHNISDAFKLQLVSSVYEKIKKNNDRIVRYDTKIKNIITLAQLKTLVIGVMFVVMNFKFMVTGSVSDMVIGLFWSLPIVSTLTAMFIIVYFKR
jgi:signal-transduction protein with cAMP-binding, CBS, and nucleotidyltransferase domain